MELYRQLANVLLQQQGPAETTDYMVLGYSVLFVVLGIYLVSLYLRNRNLKRDAELLEEIEAQESGGSENMARATMSS